MGTTSLYIINYNLGYVHYVSKIYCRGSGNRIECLDIEYKHKHIDIVESTTSDGQCYDPLSRSELTRYFKNWWYIKMGFGMITTHLFLKLLK